ncbi:MAG: hypothetical protein AAFR16_06275, partial [Pseudomonadota bacterium]
MLSRGAAIPPGRSRAAITWALTWAITSAITWAKQAGARREDVCAPFGIATAELERPRGARNPAPP